MLQRDRKSQEIAHGNQRTFFGRHIQRMAARIIGSEALRMALSIPVIKFPTGSPPKLSLQVPAPARAGTKAEQKKMLETAGQDDLDYYDIAMLAIGIVLSSVQMEYLKPQDLKYPITSIGNGMQAVLDAAKGTDARSKDMTGKLTGDRRNPFFEKNNAALGRESPITQAYLTSRRWKKVGASGVQAFGSLALLLPPTGHTNIPGVVYHGTASCLTLAHMSRIQYIRSKYKEEQRLKAFCDLVQVAKAVKLALRAPQAIGAAIPAASLPISIAASVLKTGVKMTMVGACYAAAAVIHWEAYKEQMGVYDYTELADLSHFILPEIPKAAALTLAPARPGMPARNGPPARPAAPPTPPAVPSPAVKKTGVTGRAAGPASAIFWELLTKRGPTWLLGKYDIEGLVAEPAAWLAIGDKLTLI